jgi:hypothetical protein
MAPPRFAARQFELVGLDFAPSHRQPSTVRVLAATALAIVGSLAADAVIVAAGKAAFPATKGYEHYRFADYAKLTIIGVIIACLAWPIVTRVSSKPKMLYARLAVLVTVVLLLPDVWLLHKNQPTRAVAVLMVMHLAIAIVTYLAVVTVAATRSARVRT